MANDRPGGDWRHSGGGLATPRAAARKTSRRAWQPGGPQSPAAPGKARSRGRRLLLAGAVTGGARRARRPPHLALLAGTLSRISCSSAPPAATRSRCPRTPRGRTPPPSSLPGPARVATATGPGSTPTRSWQWMHPARGSRSTPSRRISSSTSPPTAARMRTAPTSGWPIRECQERCRGAQGPRPRHRRSRRRSRGAARRHCWSSTRPASPSSWPHGLLFNDFARALKELDSRIEEIPGLAVICASDDDQRSWLFEERGVSVFGHYFLQAMQGAGHDRGQRITAATAFAYTKGEVERWSIANRAEKQTPILLPQASGQARAEKIDLAATPAARIPESVRASRAPVACRWNLRTPGRRPTTSRGRSPPRRPTTPRSGANTSICSSATSG